MMIMMMMTTINNDNVVVVVHDNDMLLQAIMMMTDGEDQEYDVCEDGIAVMAVIRTFRSEHKYKIENECDCQKSNQSHPQNSCSFTLFTSRQDWCDKWLSKPRKLDLESRTSS